MRLNCRIPPGAERRGGTSNYIVFCIIPIPAWKVKILLDALCLYHVYLTVYHPFCNDIQKTGYLQFLIFL